MGFVSQNSFPWGFFFKFGAHKITIFKGSPLNDSWHLNRAKHLGFATPDGVQAFPVQSQGLYCFDLLVCVCHCILFIPISQCHGPLSCAAASFSDFKISRATWGHLPYIKGSSLTKSHSVKCIKDHRHSPGAQRPHLGVPVTEELESERNGSDRTPMHTCDDGSHVAFPLSSLHDIQDSICNQFLALHSLGHCHLHSNWSMLEPNLVSEEGPRPPTLRSCNAHCPQHPQSWAEPGDSSHDSHSLRSPCTGRGVHHWTTCLSGSQLLQL